MFLCGGPAVFCVFRECSVEACVVGPLPCAPSFLAAAIFGCMCLARVSVSLSESE